MTDLGESRKLLQTTEIDGVPTFFVDSGQTAMASLCFRAGLADERLATHGWTHLVEHMTMHGLRRPEVDANASVDLWMTQFSVHGERDSVVEWLRDLSAQLTSLDTGSLDHERKILLAEAAQRGYSDMAWHLDLRYGAEGVGLANYDELGLHVITSEALLDYARPLFTRGNAALALNFDPRDDVRIALPEGDRRPIPPARTLKVRLPGRHPGRPQAISVSGTLTDSKLSNVVAAVCAEALTERLRHEHGSSYGAQGSIERVDEDTLVLCLWADVSEGARADAARMVRDTLDGLARTGVDPSEVTRAVTRLRRALDDDQTQVWQAFNSAQARLRGVLEPFTYETLRSYLASIQPEDVTRQVRGFVTSAIYGIPEGGETFSVPELMFPQGQEGGATSPRLPRTRTTVFRALAPGDGSLLAIGESSVAVSSSEGVRWFSLDETSAVLTYPDGARTAVTKDGRTVHVEPDLWFRGDRAAHLLTETVGRVADVIPMPERDPSGVVKLSPVQRARKVAWLAVVTKLGLPIFLTIAIVALVAGASAVGVLALGWMCWTAVQEAREARRRRATLFE